MKFWGKFRVESRATGMPGEPVGRLGVAGGRPRPLWLVLLLSIASLGVYYSWYKWTIFDELRRYRGTGLWGSQVMLPFMVGTGLPLVLYVFDPDVPVAFCGGSIVGLAWIVGMQWYLYRVINQLYCEGGQPAPLRVAWVWVPGLNLVVGCQQIRVLCRYWQGNFD
ncbi:MAG: hypothetical protein ACO4AI_14945 [Prochlorothrix sp.]